MASSKMGFLTVVSYFIVVIFSVNAKEYIPVLVWESPNPGGKEASATALSQMSLEDFSDVLVRRVGQSPVVVLFSEKTLSVEDFSRQHSGLRESFPALKSLSEDAGLQYIPAVQSPFKALNRLTQLGYKWEELSGDALPEKGKKILLVNFDDVEPVEDRSDLLLRHDNRIASLYRRMQEKYPSVLAIYTGEHSSWTAPESSLIRNRRQSEPTSSVGEKCGTALITSGTSDPIILYSSECPVLKYNNTYYNLTSGATFPSDNRKGVHRMSVLYKLDNTAEKVNLRFRFNLTDNGFWRLTQADFDDAQNQKVVLETKSDVSAPIGFSYNCGSETVFANADGSVSLKFKNLKVQPVAQSKVLGPTTDCVPFFTIGIWSGLLVSFLLLFIVGWGIDMMMNIHTMDRYDDPKGKPLVFNVQE